MCACDFALKDLNHELIHTKLKWSPWIQLLFEQMTLSAYCLSATSATVSSVLLARNE